MLLRIYDMCLGRLSLHAYLCNFYARSIEFFIRIGMHVTKEK